MVDPGDRSDQIEHPLEDGEVAVLPSALGSSALVESAEADGVPRPKRLPLHALHKDLVAVFRRRLGALVPWDYPGLEATAEGTKRADLPGYPSPTSLRGIADWSDHDRLEVVGADRQRFLGGLVTSDVAKLQPGAGAYGFVTSLKGKVLADVAVANFDDRIFLLLPPGRREAIETHLNKYIVADRVEVLPLDEMIPLALIGAAVREKLVELGAWPESAWGCQVTELFGTQFPVSRHERLGAPALMVWVSSSIAREVAEELASELDLEWLGRGVLEDLRAETFLPAWGIDYDDSHLPQESSIEAVDFTKGCYLGQEIVARLHYRGQAPRFVKKLRVMAPAGELEPGAVVEFEDRDAGSVTTVGAVDPESTDGVATLCLAMLQRRASEGGVQVRVVTKNGERDRAPAQVL